MAVYKFNDGMGNRDRSCFYGIMLDGKVYSQSEAVEAKLAVFQSLAHEKNGKWSNTTWQVTTKSAKLVACMSPFNGWPETIKGCLDHVVTSNAGYTGETLTEEEARVFFFAKYPKTAARIQALEAAASELV